MRHRKILPGEMNHVLLTFVVVSINFADQLNLIETNLSEDANLCCERHKKLTSIGFGLDGEEYYVDVGHCRHRCPIQDHQLINLRPNSCTDGYHCLPSTIKQEVHTIVGGPISVDVISECSCYLKENQCVRQSKNLRFFPDSSFQVDVDVGACRGHCAASSEETCQPVRNRTKSVSGPNGDQCVQVIEECSCSKSCYLMHKFAVYFDGGSSGNESKVIDIGKCVGNCDGKTGSKCVLRDDKNSSVCLMSLTGISQSCVPTSYSVHHLSNGKTLMSITDCACN